MRLLFCFGVAGRLVCLFLAALVAGAAIHCHQLLFAECVVVHVLVSVFNTSSLRCPAYAISTSNYPSPPASRLPRPTALDQPNATHSSLLLPVDRWPLSPIPTRIYPFALGRGTEHDRVRIAVGTADELETLGGFTDTVYRTYHPPSCRTSTTRTSRCALATR